MQNSMQNKLSDPFQSIHIVIPVSADETLWRDLLNDLVSLPRGSKVSLVGAQNISIEEIMKVNESGLFDVMCWATENSFAEALNQAAFSSQSDFLWFLHADSKLPKSTLAKVKLALEKNPDAIYYCQLQFLDDGPRFMFINSLAVQLRSQLLNLSFGHQGLAMSRRTFERVGGFSETVQSDVVLDFLIRAKSKKIALREVPSPIYTSARYYKKNGWLKASLERFAQETSRTLTSYISL